MYFILLRILPKVVGFLLMKLTNVKIKFGSIALSKARDIHIVYKDFDLQIKEIAVKSNFFNAEISNPVQIYIRDVRINKNIEKSEDSAPKKQKISSDEPIKQIPKMLLTFLQVCV